MTTVPIDLDELLDRLGGDREVVDELLAIFYDDTRPRLPELQADVPALGEWRRLAHTLKGACGNIAAMPASDAAARLEAAAASGDVPAAHAARSVLLTELERLLTEVERLRAAREGDAR